MSMHDQGPVICAGLTLQLQSIYDLEQGISAALGALRSGLDLNAHIGARYLA
jgi:hypothetical protein